MKKILLFAAMLLCSTAFAQTEADPYDLGEEEAGKSYKASNGVTYYEGDSVRLGFGSSGDGYFQFVHLAGFAAAATYNSRNTSHGQMAGAPGLANTSYRIVKIRRGPAMAGRKVYFTIKGIQRYTLIIEEAIARCEVTPCPDQGKGQGAAVSGADELAKFKKLADDGVITPEEFAEKKRQILNR